MIAPKWLVLGVVLGAFALLANYDIQLGLTAGALIGLVAAGILWARVRLAEADSLPGQSRGALIERFGNLTRNRRLARSKELNGQKEPLGRSIKGRISRRIARSRFTRSD